MAKWYQFMSWKLSKNTRMNSWNLHFLIQKELNVTFFKSPYTYLTIYSNCLVKGNILFLYSSLVFFMSLLVLYSISTSSWKVRNQRRQVAFSFMTSWYTQPHIHISICWNFFAQITNMDTVVIFSFPPWVFLYCTVQCT